MVGFNRVEEIVASLGQERVDREVEEREVWSERVGGNDGVAFNGGEGAGWLGHYACAEEFRDLVEEGGDPVGVVDLDREFL